MTTIPFGTQMTELKRFFEQTQHALLDSIFAPDGEIDEYYQLERREFERLAAPNQKFPFKVYRHFEHRMIILDRKEFPVGRHVVVVALVKKLGADGQPVDCYANGVHILVYTPLLKRLVYIAGYGHAKTLNDVMLLWER